mgnify:CR=1 FL=1
MSEYIVKGADESVENVDILGELRKVGDVVELAPEAAEPLVAEGKLELRPEVKRYTVVGVEGEKANIKGIDYDCGIGVEVDLTDAEAEQPLADSKIELKAQSGENSVRPPVAGLAAGTEVR